MISLYKFISEQELKEIMERSFKKFPPHFPLRFYIDKIPENFDNQLLFLVKIETNKENISRFNIQNDDELIINDIEDLDRINVLIDDKIKIIRISENSKELRQDIIRILEKEKRFFEFRLKIYLDTNNKEIIPHDYFEREMEPDDNIPEPTNEELEASAKYYDDKLSKINTVEEAVDFLINEKLSENSVNEIKNRSLASKFDNLSGLFGSGMYFRNILIYPNKNENFKQYLKTYDPQYIVDRGEFGEGIIEDFLWRKLNNYLITDESKKKIADLRNEPYDENSCWSNYIKEQLLSYNLGEAIIREYLEMEDKKDASDEDFERYHYEQKRILTGISKDEKSGYDQITQDYFAIRNLIEQLKHNP